MSFVLRKYIPMEFFRNRMCKAEPQVFNADITIYLVKKNMQYLRNYLIKNISNATLTKDKKERLTRLIRLKFRGGDK